MLNCCKRKKGTYELDILDFKDYEIPISRNKPDSCVRKSIAVVLVLLVVQMLIYAGLSYFGVVIYFKTNDMIPPIERIVHQVDEDLPRISAVVMQSPEIVRIIKQTNESLPQIVNIINNLDLNIPRINSLINTLVMLDTNSNVVEIQKIIDKIPEIIKVIDFVYKNIPHITLVLDRVNDS